MFRVSSTLGFGAALLLSGTPAVKAVCQQYLDAASTAATNLQNTYFVGGTYPQATQWVWISAVDAFYLHQLDTVRGTSQYADVVNTVFNGWQNWLDTGGSYDDVQWVAITYAQAGQVDNAKHYYDIAASAWTTDYCGGGLFWSSARDYKNAVTNELYMASSGLLYEKTLDQTYLNNLKDAWNWLSNTKMRGDNGLFNDGLTREGACNNNGQTQWTYNQGVVLVGLGYLYKFTQDENAVTAAWGIMDSVIADMTINGGLREACETDTVDNCNTDQTVFKGILVQYMAWFLDITGRDNAGKYSSFIKQQGDKVLQFAVGPPGFYSNLWYAANQNSAQWTAQSQGSALGALVAAAMQNC